MVKKRLPEGVTALLFDMDGTLIDSMWMWDAIDIEFLDRYGLTMPPTLKKDIEGYGFHETAIYFKEHFPIPDTVEEIMDCWNEMAHEKYLHEVPLKEGVLEFLQQARAQGLKMGIATSNSRQLTEAVLNALHITEYFDCVLTSHEVQHGKPAPDIYIRLAQELNTAPEHCLVFEDVPAGILAGHRAGMRAWAVEDTWSAHMRTEKYEQADDYIESFEQLVDNH